MDEAKPSDDGLWGAVIKFLKFCFLLSVVLYFAATVVVVAILHHPAWHIHLLQFINRTWLVFVAEKIGSTGPGFVNSIVAAIVGFIFTVIGIGFFQGRAAMRKHLIETIAMGIVGLATVLFLVYGTQFAWEVANAGFNDHQELVTTIKSDATIISALRNQPKQLCPSGKPCEAAKDQCWMQNITIPPQKSFLSSMETVILCNHKVKAPLTVVIEYDQNPAAGSGFAFQGKRIIDAEELLQKNKYFAKFNSPSILPYEFFIVTVQGATEKPPTATKTTLHAIDPDQH